MIPSLAPLMSSWNYSTYSISCLLSRSSQAPLVFSAHDMIPSSVRPYLLRLSMRSSSIYSASVLVQGAPQSSVYPSSHSASGLFLYQQREASFHITYSGSLMHQDILPSAGSTHPSMNMALGFLKAITGAAASGSGRWIES